MSLNKLKLNPNKTEIILIGSKSKKSKLITSLPDSILGEKIDFNDKVRNLGVIFDSDFSFTQHISSVCKSCFYHIRDLSRIRRHLTLSTATSLANALVSSRLDYCNSLFYRLTEKELARLQRIQNTLCRIVTRISRYSSTSGPMKSLHWLPVKFRILFKINLLTYKALHFGKPIYIKNYLNYYTSARSIRRSNPGLGLLATPNYERCKHP